MNDYAVSIKDITTGQYVTDECNGKCKLGEEDDRIIFYNEDEAEAIRACLDENYNDCFVLEEEEI